MTKPKHFFVDDNNPQLEQFIADRFIPKSELEKIKLEQIDKILSWLPTMKKQEKRKDVRTTEYNFYCEGVNYCRDWLIANLLEEKKQIKDKIKSLTK